MVVRLACFVQAHDQDVTVFASNLILLIPAQNLSKDSLPYVHQSLQGCEYGTRNLGIRRGKYAICIVAQ